jgi:translation elongation factor EF-Tu-like GTPase
MAGGAQRQRHQTVGVAPIAPVHGDLLAVPEQRAAPDPVQVLLAAVRGRQPAPGLLRVHPRGRDDGGCPAQLLSEREGGRHTLIASGYRPQFFVRTTSVVGEVDLAGTVTALLD